MNTTPQTTGPGDAIIHEIARDIDIANNPRILFGQTGGEISELDLLLLNTDPAIILIVAGVVLLIVGLLVVRQFSAERRGQR